MPKEGAAGLYCKGKIRVAIVAHSLHTQKARQMRSRRRSVVAMAYSHTYTLTQAHSHTGTHTQTAANCIWTPKWQLHDGACRSERKPHSMGQPTKRLISPIHTHTQIACVYVLARILSRKTCVKHNYLLWARRERERGGKRRR